MEKSCEIADQNIYKITNYPISIQFRVIKKTMIHDYNSIKLAYSCLLAHTHTHTRVSLTQILFAMPDLTKFCREDGLINEVPHRHRSLGYLCILPRTVSLKWQEVSGAPR